MIGEWIEWTGGDCPCGPRTVVEWKTRGMKDPSSFFGPREADLLHWAHINYDDDIVAFRVVGEVKMHDEPPYHDPAPGVDEPMTSTALVRSKLVSEVTDNGFRCRACGQPVVWGKDGGGCTSDSCSNPLTFDFFKKDDGNIGIQLLRPGVRNNRSIRDPDPAKGPVLAADVDLTLAGRQQTHGDYLQTARIAQDLKHIFRANHPSNMSVDQLESLDLIATKIARILSGNPNEPDHWHDLAGYARLVETRLRGEV